MTDEVGDRNWSFRLSTDDEQLTEFISIGEDGTIYVHGEPTRNPWVIGKAVMEWSSWWTVYQLENKA